MSSYNVPVVKCQTKKRKVADEVDGTAGEVSTGYFRHLVTIKAGKYYYGVQIKTGEQLCAGTIDGVFLNLIGSKAQTGKYKLQSSLFDKGLSRSSSEVFVIVSEQDLGGILVVTVGCDAEKIKDDWYVNFVAVANLQTDEMERFPVYHWIGPKNSVSVTANTTTLKDVGDNTILQNQRTDQLTQRKALYKWLKFPETGLPSGIDDTMKTLPPDEQFGAVKKFDFNSGAIEALAALGIKCTDLAVSSFFSLFKTADELVQYEQLAEVLKLKLGSAKPLYQAGRWTSDVEFGRQMLNGVNPVIITKCSELPSKFPVTEEMVKPLLVRGLSLKEEMKNGRVYICDMNMMDGLEAKQGCYNVAPICLLYVNGSGQLVPIAIQLKQGVKEEEKENNPIFLPTDHWIDWLRAKIFYRSAHGQYHELYTHYTTCHATMEAFAMGIQRNLPDPHPIFKLLRPHIRYTMAINVRARATLINKGGIIDHVAGIGGAGTEEMFRRIGKCYNVHRSNIKKNAKERGVDDSKQLPGYYYRDDGFKLWDALEKYARGIINEFYKSDEDVKADTELQAWAEDTHTNGFPGFHGVPNGHGFPSSISTRDELCELCTLIMFTGSAQHASVNFMQYYIYQYIPNAPFCVRRPPPAKKGEADYQNLLETLPDEWSSVLAIGTTHLLSQYSQNEKYLGDYEPRFGEKKAAHLIESFKSSLRSISGDILERNRSLDMPYTGMLPDNVPNSITI